jgi:activator of 2-hydroxyglutaryl-CoA dehydratase
MQYYLGVDIGSVSSNFVLMTSDRQLRRKLYLRTQGNPIKAIKEGFENKKTAWILNRTESAGWVPPAADAISQRFSSVPMW